MYLEKVTLRILTLGFCDVPEVFMQKSRYCESDGLGGRAASRRSPKTVAASDRHRGGSQVWWILVTTANPVQVTHFSQVSVTCSVKDVLCAVKEEPSRVNKKPLGGQVVKVKTNPEQNLTLLEMAQTEEMITCSRDYYLKA